MGMEQLSIPAKVLTPPPARDNRQLSIAECGTNVALRFDFRVPVFVKGHLADFSLVRMPLCNVIDEEDYATMFRYDPNKVAALFMDGMRTRVQRKFRYTDEQMRFVKFTGVSTLRHRACTNVDENDPRWV